MGCAGPPSVQRSSVLSTPDRPRLSRVVDDDRADALCSSSCNMRNAQFAKKKLAPPRTAKASHERRAVTARARSQRARHARDHRIVTRSMLRSDALICRSPTSAGRIHRSDPSTVASTSSSRLRRRPPAAPKPRVAPSVLASAHIYLTLRTHAATASRACSLQAVPASGFLCCALQLSSRSEFLVG